MKAQVPGPPTVTSSPILRVISPPNIWAQISRRQISLCRSLARMLAASRHHHVERAATGAHRRIAKRGCSENFPRKCETLHTCRMREHSPLAGMSAETDWHPRRGDGEWQAKTGRSKAGTSSIVAAITVVCAKRWPTPLPRWAIVAGTGRRLFVARRASAFAPECRRLHN
jgi:hypothetical protein